MSARLANICVDCTDPRALAHWWAQVLEDFEIVDDGEMNADEAELRGPGGRWLMFLRVPEAKSTKNRLLMCLRPSGSTRDTEIDRILGLGATMFDDRRDGDGWAVLTDPEGNEFCVLSRTAEEAGIDT